MIHTKPGVSAPKGASLHLIDAIACACYHYTKAGHEFMMTSLGDGQHGPRSKHYSEPCDAVDVRTRHVPVSELPALVRDIQCSLGKDYDVVLEETHLHIEYDVKSLIRN